MTRKTAADRRSQRSHGRQSRPKRKARDSSGKMMRGKFHKFEVHKAYCAPCRSIVQDLSDRFEIPVTDFQQGVVVGNVCTGFFGKAAARKMVTDKSGIESDIEKREYPVCMWSTFRVPAARARWFEDIVNYDGQLKIVSGSLDAKSRARGKRGTIRHAWKERTGYSGPVGTGGIVSVRSGGKIVGQVEKNCKSGMNFWKSRKGKK